MKTPSKSSLRGFLFTIYVYFRVKIHKNGIHEMIVLLDKNDNYAMLKSNLI